MRSISAFLRRASRTSRATREKATTSPPPEPAARQNREEWRGAQDLFAVRDSGEAEALTRHSRDVDAIPDDSPELIRRKKELFEASHRDTAWLRQKQACDLWTAAFFQTLAADSVFITSTGLADHLGGRPVDARLHGCAGALALRQPFCHWPLELSEVFARGGFDVMLSNRRQGGGIGVMQPSPLGHDLESTNIALGFRRPILHNQRPEQECELSSNYESSRS